MHQRFIMVVLEGEESYYDDNHAKYVLLSRPVRSEEQKRDCNGDGSDGEAELCVGSVPHHDDKLYREREKKEKVEFQESDVYLVKMLVSRLALH